MEERVPAFVFKLRDLVRAVEELRQTFGVVDGRKLRERGFVLVFVFVVVFVLVRVAARFFAFLVLLFRRSQRG